MLFILVLSIWYSCQNTRNGSNEAGFLNNKFIEDTILSIKEMQDKNHFVASISGNKKGIAIMDVCWEKENEQRISRITIMEPSALKTTRDIGIGSSREQVLIAYKPEIDPRAENQKSIIRSVFGGLIFEMQNNKVKSIFIGAAAE